VTFFSGENLTIFVKKALKVVFYRFVIKQLQKLSGLISRGPMELLPKKERKKLGYGL